MFAVLMGCQYLPQKSFYHQKLCALLNLSSNMSTLDYLKKALKVPDDVKPDKIALALDHAFGQGVLQSFKVNDDIMKIMLSTVLSEKSKYRLIKETTGKNISSSEIPLGITKASSLTFDPTRFTSPSDKRKKEAVQIRSNLSMTDLRSTSVYKPLLVVCEDELVLEYYQEIIKSCFFESPVSHIRFHEGDKCDLSHSNDNIFIASMEKHNERNVIILLDRCERLTPEESTDLAVLLKAGNRKHYKSGSNPSIEIDLSGTLPVLFATTVPDKSVAECCDVVFATELTQSEFHKVLEKTLDKKREVFKLTSLSMEAAVSEFLFDYSSATVTSLLNKTIAQLRHSTQDVHITVSDLQRMINIFYTGQNKKGFWRDIVL